jgi:hypothetical protein
MRGHCITTRIGSSLGSKSRTDRWRCVLADLAAIIAGHRRIVPRAHLDLEAIAALLRLLVAEGPVRHAGEREALLQIGASDQRQLLARRAARFHDLRAIERYRAVSRRRQLQAIDGHAGAGDVAGGADDEGVFRRGGPGDVAIGDRFAVVRPGRHAARRTAAVRRVGQRNLQRPLIGRTLPSSASSPTAT